jgi:hypothetical protein
MTDVPLPAYVEPEPVPIPKTEYDKLRKMTPVVMSDIGGNAQSGFIVHFNVSEQLNNQPGPIPMMAKKLPNLANLTFDLGCHAMGGQYNDDGTCLVYARAAQPTDKCINNKGNILDIQYRDISASDQSLKKEKVVFCVEKEYDNEKFTEIAAKRADKRAGELKAPCKACNKEDESDNEDSDKKTWWKFW